MGQLLQLAVTLTTVDCGSCGGSYAINERYRQQCQDYGRSWTCPYCKTGWGFSGNGELAKAQRELEAEKQPHSACPSARERATRGKDEAGAQAKARRAWRLPGMQSQFPESRPPHELQAQGFRRVSEGAKTKGAG